MTNQNQPIETIQDGYDRPSEAELTKYAQDFMRVKYTPKEIRDLKACGDFQIIVDGKVAACERVASNMIEDQAIFPPQAWNWAIKQEILEIDPD